MLKYVNLNIRFISFCLLFIPFLSFAQSSVGINGGLNIASLSLSDPMDEAKFNSIENILIGATINFNIEGEYYISIQPRYNQKGQDVKISIPGLPDLTETRFNYFELPVYFIGKFKYSNINPYIILGLNFGYLLSATTKITESGQINSYDVLDDFKRYDICSDVGIGIEYLINDKYALTFNSQYSYGFIDISKDQGEVKTRGIQFLLGVIYNL